MHSSIHKYQHKGIRVASLASLVFFFIWILPLGIFIKPSQEQIACNGQRAICMCTVVTQGKQPNTFVIKSPTTAQSKSETSASSHYFLTEAMLSNTSTKLKYPCDVFLFLYSNPAQETSSPVPKA